MTIASLEKTYETAQETVKKVELNWQRVKLPPSIIKAFSKAWEESQTHPAIRSTGFTRLHTSADRSENITDFDLSLGIAVSPLRELLHKYRDTAIKLADESDVKEFHNEYKSKIQGIPACWPKLETAIDSSEVLNAEQKELIKSFLTDSERFYDIKGIVRYDFATPALCRASGKRIDRFSIIDQIAAAANTNPSIYREFVDFIDHIDEISDGATTEFEMNEALPKNLKASLLAKPFTILTGGSGTGKTKLAISLAKYLSIADASNYEIVAVGADWTDNRNVLGFVNHLHTDDEGPRYQSTPILDLLLRADKDPEVPYFLILDEMNLSHVERYFADFLSAMEQKRGPLKLHSESRDLRRSGESEADVPPELNYPDNLFVIGTVNIDETTYMFSPKVLDRANVIEFTVSEPEIAAFLKEPKAYPAIEPAEPGVAEGFLQLAKQARAMGCATLPEESAAKISRHLLDLFKILKAERFEFAYRTAKEINIYLQVCHHLAENHTDWAQTKPIPLEERKAGKSNCLTDLDDQILQKLLPKLHGSIGRIGKLLARLAHYCHSGERDANASTQLDAAAQLQATDSTPFPKSLAKLQSMIRTLKDEQFVSFIQ